MNDWGKGVIEDKGIERKGEMGEKQELSRLKELFKGWNVYAHKVGDTGWAIMVPVVASKVHTRRCDRNIAEGEAV